MSPRALSLLSVFAVAAVLLAAAPPVSAESSEYRSQLDANGQALYATLDSVFEDAKGDPGRMVTVEFSMVPSLYTDADEAEAYVLDTINAVLAAYYLTNPLPIWIWDYPVTGVTQTAWISSGSIDIDGVTYYYCSSAGFELYAPDAYSDEEIPGVISAVESALVAYEGTDEEKVSSINSLLRGVTVGEDAEGTVSNVYDALVQKKSSSAGVAAAFTCLCEVSGVTAVTIKGDVLTDVDAGKYADGYWNATLIGGAWYATDCTLNSSTSDNCLMCGWATAVSFDGYSLTFGGTRAVDLDMACANGLSAPSVSSLEYGWSDEVSLWDQWGAYIVLAVIAIIIVAALVYAVRKGEFRRRDLKKRTYTRTNNVETSRRRR